MPLETPAEANAVRPRATIVNLADVRPYPAPGTPAAADDRVTVFHRGDALVFDDQAHFKAEIRRSFPDDPAAQLADLRRAVEDARRDGYDHGREIGRAETRRQEAAAWSAHLAQEKRRADLAELAFVLVLFVAVAGALLAVSL
jgi:hypothetical protein